VNCQTTREVFELARPDAPDAATVAQAEQHLSGCLSCRAAVRQQEELDSRVGTLCRDVSIPLGLKDRLLAGLEAGASDGIAIDGTAASTSGLIGVGVENPRDISATASIPVVGGGRGVGSRRRLLGRISLAVASLMAMGLGAWSLWPSRPSVNLEEITALMATAEIDPANLAEFTTFRGGLSPQTPRTMITIPLETSPRRLGNYEAAIYFFKLDGRQGKIDGRLAVVPRHFVNARDVPSATAFPGPFTYHAQFRSTAWAEGKFVYVCCLSGGKDELDWLVRPRPQPV
jgi:hypothetical protein